MKMAIPTTIVVDPSRSGMERDVGDIDLWTAAGDFDSKIHHYANTSREKQQQFRKQQCDSGDSIDLWADVSKATRRRSNSHSGEAHLVSKRGDEKAKRRSSCGYSGHSRDRVNMELSSSQPRSRHSRMPRRSTMSDYQEDLAATKARAQELLRAEATPTQQPTATKVRQERRGSMGDYQHRLLQAKNCFDAQHDAQQARWQNPLNKVCETKEEPVGRWRQALECFDKQNEILAKGFTNALDSGKPVHASNHTDSKPDRRRMKQLLHPRMHRRQTIA